MRAKVNAKEFIQTLDKVNGLIRKSAIPALEAVLVRIEENRCTLTSTNLESWLSMELPAQGDGFAFLLGRPKETARAFRQFDGELLLEQTETGEGAKRRLRLVLSCGPRSAELSPFLPEDFPEQPKWEPRHMFTANAAELYARVERVKYATGVQDQKNYRAFQGSIQFRGNHIYTVDGHRLSCDTDPELTVPIPFMASPQVLSHLKLFSNQKVTFQLGKLFALATDGVTTLTFHLPEGELFDVYSAIPSKYQTEFEVYPKDFLNELDYLKRSLRGKIRHAVQFSNTDLAAARDDYSELQNTRRLLADALGSAQLLLMEAEEYQTAATAGKLREGLLSFNLLSNTYRPVYDALNGFAAQLPVDGTTNARVVGRLMNNIKMGYYPTDPDNISLILRGVRFPEGITTNLLDPCCGCGKALRQIAQGNNCFTYGVELDEARADEAQTRLHRVGFGSFFYSQVSMNSFHLLFLNPPYLSVLNESGSKARHEKRFLIESLGCLALGGLLVYVIPYYRLTPDICRVLVDNFENLGLWRFTDGEFKKFKQVVVMGVRKTRDVEPQDTQWLEYYAAHPGSIPILTELPEGRYVLPARPLEVRTFRGENFNAKELERQLVRSDSFRQMMGHSELDSGVKRPPLPLSISQIGLIGGSGMINGLIQCDTPHVIKGRIVKVVRTETDERFSASGNYLGAEIHETITNKMIFNILTPNGFKALT